MIAAEWNDTYWNRIRAQDKRASQVLSMKGARFDL